MDRSLGQGTSPKKVTDVHEPVIRELEGSSTSDDGSQGEYTTASRVLSPSPPPLSTIRIQKRSSSNTKRSGFSRSSYGRTTTVNVVKEQYASVRQRCLRDLGAGVGFHAFDTSHDGLREWIKNERLTRLPHKGGSWDRVLIAAQYFAAQVHHLSEVIDSFTPDCEAASNLVFGQCLLLLEVSLRQTYRRAVQKSDK
jgi:hypothetical protein